MSWWGNTGATPEPVKDPRGRAGYWWWPTEPASNVNDTEVWGNRGVIYYVGWEKPAPTPPVTPPPAPETPKEPGRKMILLNNVLFDFDKSTLRPEGKVEIDKLVAEMKKYPGDTVVIMGHTCDIGTDAYNMGLGQRRADSVKAYMLQSGIDAGRVSTVSQGESMPAVPNSSPANRALNRRAEFNITMGM
jgi:outer membrane protein OmpA-like peptidoglycan-associated protein